MRILGWNLDQWSVAKARHSKMDVSIVPTTFSGMLILRTWWVKNEWADPLSIEIIGVECEKDNKWSSRAFVENSHRVLLEEGD